MMALRLVGVVLGLLVMAVCAGLAALGVSVWTAPGYRGNGDAMMLALLICLGVAIAAGWGVYALIRRLRKGRRAPQ